MSNKLSLIQLFVLLHLNPAPFKSVPLHAPPAPARAYCLNFHFLQSILSFVNTSMAELCCHLTLVIGLVTSRGVRDRF